MRGLAAVVDLGPTPRNDGSIDRAASALAQAMAHRGAERDRVRGAGSTLVSLGRAGAVPRRGRERRHEGIVDVRLDDRRGLADSLGVAETSDEELFLEAWERWGDDVLRRVVGDFAAVLWDARERELVLLRDGLGIRQLHVARRGPILLVATEMQALTASEHGVPVELDPLSCARFLIETYCAGPTLLRGIDAVEPGTVQRWTPRAHRSRRVWWPDPFAKGPTDPSASAERLREALDQAVRARMSTTGPTASLVSGGHDSSSVQVLAARAARDAGQTPPSLLHLAFPGLPCDEARFVEAVAAASGAPLVEVDPREHPEVTSPASPAVEVGELYDITVAMNRPLLERVDPGTVVLTGCGGDDLLFRTSQDCIDHLRARRPLAAVRAARESKRGPLAATRFLAGQISRILVGGELRDTLRRLRPSRGVWPAWLVDPVRAQLDAWHADRMLWRASLAAPSEVQRRLALALLGDSGTFLLLERVDLLGVSAGVEFRHPFYDRRVIEALLGTPAEQRASATSTKDVLRRAMRGLLPEVVRTRQDAADFGHYADPIIVTTHVEHYRRAFQSSALEREGIVKPGVLLASLAPDRNLSLPWRAMAIETAVRTIREARASNRRPCPTLPAPPPGS